MVADATAFVASSMAAMAAAAVCPPPPPTRLLPTRLLPKCVLTGERRDFTRPHTTSCATNRPAGGERAIQEGGHRRTLRADDQTGRARAPGRTKDVYDHG